MVVLYAVFPVLPGLIRSPGGCLPIVATLATSLTITVLELVPQRITPELVINDNLAVPLFQGWCFDRRRRSTDVVSDPDHAVTNK
jgi:hypothetical protein